MKKFKIPCRIKCLYHKAHVAAHRSEAPLHAAYLSAVFWHSGAAYGYIAIIAAVAMLLAWDFRA